MEDNFVSVFANVKSIEPLCKKTLLELCTTDHEAETIKLLRAMKKGSDDYKVLKESLPCFTPSIECTRRGAKYMTKHSSYVCLDFDGIEDVEAFKQKLFQLKFITFCAASCSGNGVYALVKIEKPHLHQQHYDALIKYFEVQGMKIDTSCKDLARLRIISYDPHYLYNEYASVWKETILPKQNIFEVSSKAESNSNFYERAIYAIRDYVMRYGIDITTGRGYWLGIGTFIVQTLGQTTGKNVFKEISMFHPCFSESEFERCFNDVCQCKNQVGIGVLLNACKRSNIPYVKELIK